MYDELTKRDKLNLDIFWLKDESLENRANLPSPDVIAQEVVEDLQSLLPVVSRASPVCGNCRGSEEVKRESPRPRGAFANTRGRVRSPNLQPRDRHAGSRRKCQKYEAIRTCQVGSCFPDFLIESVLAKMPS